MATVTDSVFGRLLSELASRSGLSEEKLSELIQEKRTTVGGGYLTERGALFLIASDLGVTIEFDQDKVHSLSELPNEQSSVTITCRMLSAGVPKIFSRKSDAKKGVFSRAIFFDDSKTTSVCLWDGAAFSLVEEGEFKPGDLLKISNAYVRLGLDGAPALNVGEKAKIERCREESSPQRIGQLHTRVLSLSSIPENGNMLAVFGRIDGEVKRTAFTRSDGSSSDLVSFVLCDTEKPIVKHRVVIWGNSNPSFSSLRHSEVVTLLNVRTKVSQFQNTVSLEIHGDDGTCILEYWDDFRKWMKELKSNHTSNEAEEKSTEAVANKPLPFVARILSLRTGDGKSHALLVDSQKRQINITAGDEAVDDLSPLGLDDVVVCKPETLDWATFRAFANKRNSFVRSKAKRADIPTSSSLLSTVEDLKKSGIVSLELMCLTDPVEREIQSKDGLVKRTEITVADHTGEIKLYCWRGLAKMLEGYSAGDRIILGAVEAQTHEGKKFLVLKNFSSIFKKAS